VSQSSRYLLQLLSFFNDLRMINMTDGDVVGYSKILCRCRSNQYLLLSCTYGKMYRTLVLYSKVEEDLLISSSYVRYLSMQCKIILSYVKCTYDMF